MIGCKRRSKEMNDDKNKDKIIADLEKRIKTMAKPSAPPQISEQTHQQIIGENITLHYPQIIEAEVILDR